MPRPERPLAAFAAAFAAACLVCAYFAMPTQLYLAATVSVLLTVSIFAVRTRRADLSFAAIGFFAGFVWASVLGEPLKLANDAMQLARSRGEGVFFVPTLVANRLAASLSTVFPERLAPFLRSLTLADAHEFQADGAMYTAFSMSGVAHIAAVSGMHVSFLMSMIGYVARGRNARIAVGVPTLILFMAVTGFNPPVCRAVIMAFFAFIAPLVRRRGDGVTSVLAALLLILVANPVSASRISLQLSFLSTLGIITISPRIQDALNAHIEGLRWLQFQTKRKRVRPFLTIYNFAATSLASSVGALVFSTPLIAYYFGYVSVLAPITNLLTLWAAAYAFCGALISAAFGLLAVPVGRAAAAVAALPADWILIVARNVARIPFAAIYVANTYIIGWLIYVYAAFALYFFLRNRTAKRTLNGNASNDDAPRLRGLLYPICGSVMALCLALLLTAAMPRGTLSVTAVNVGQGQSLVLSDGSATAVIDCGGTRHPAANTAAYLQAHADEDVELFILTHFHADHAGDAIELMTRVRVGTLIIPAPDSELAFEILDYARSLGVRVFIVMQPLTVDFGESTLTVYPPYGEQDNEACLSVLATYNDWDVLVTGDMPEKTERWLMEFVDLPDIELLIAGHHGSRMSSSEDLLDDVTPELVIISVGEKNTYGHPSPDTLARFEARGIRVYRTDLLGNVTVRAK